MQAYFEKYKLPLLTVFFTFYAFVIFFNNGKISLWDQDEAAYAAFAYKMNETGNYLVPQYTWSKIHRKSPLHFWLISASYKIFGVNEFAVRFFSGLAVWTTVLIMFFWGKKFLGDFTAFLSAVILATNFYFTLLGKMALTDGLLTLLYTVTGFAFWDFVKYGKKLSLLLFWTAIALGLLVKGPPIAIFAGFLFILGLIFCKNKKSVLKIHPWFFGILALLPLTVWGFLAWKTDNGKFILWLIDWYVLKRVNSAVLGQTGPPGYYLATFLVFFLAFLPFLPMAFFRAFKDLKNRNTDIVPALWLVSGWLFYEFLKSKLPSYVLAAYPALAILTAREIKLFLNKKKFDKLLLTGVLLYLFMSFALLVLPFLSKKFLPDFDFTSLKIFVFTNFAFALIILGAVIRKNTSLLISSVVFNSLILIFLANVVILPQADKLKNSTKKVAVYISEQKKTGNALCIIENDFGHPPSLPFYIETVAQMPYITEPDCKKIKTLIEKDDKEFFLILDKKCFEKLSQEFDFQEIKKISSYTPDRKGKRVYFVVKVNKL